MHSHSGRFTITFNGEIYNYQSIAEELATKGYTFQGHSDTEVMLAAFEEWGVEDATMKFNGMFAFAVWDEQQRSLHLFRDRLGIKPVYFGWIGGGFFFGSDLRVCTQAPGFNPRLNRSALFEYLRRSFVPAPLSIYQEVFKLLPGNFLKLTGDDLGQPPAEFNPHGFKGRESELKTYWSVRDAYSLPNHLSRSGVAEEDLLDQLDSLISDSVKGRMIADVPLGSFLSGGIDSTLVTHYMLRHSTGPVKTFTIGFEDPKYDESGHAKRIAEFLGTDHSEQVLSVTEAQEMIPNLSEVYDEPFADSSQIPTALLSRFTRQSVTVALSGDGGDEILGGYTRYARASSYWKKVAKVPRSVRSVLALAIDGSSEKSLAKIARGIGKATGKRTFSETTGSRIKRLARVLKSETDLQVYDSILANCVPSDVLKLPEPPQETTLPISNELTFLERMMIEDSENYLPDGVLVKVDRASMYFSLESREPLLDYRLYEFCASIDPRLKSNAAKPKELLRKLLHRYLPAELFDRPKTGFGIPVGDWIKGPLRNWADELLDPKKLDQQRILNTQVVRQRWCEHQSGTHDWTYHLWDILMLQMWLDSNHWSLG